MGFRFYGVYRVWGFSGQGLEFATLGFFEYEPMSMKILTAPHTLHC